MIRGNILTVLWLLALASLLLACSPSVTPTVAPAATAPPPSAADPFTTLIGTRCAFAGTGATLGFHDKRLNFTCSPPADTFTGLLGDVQLGEEGWEIERAEIARSADGFSLESSEMALIAALVIE